MERRLGQMRRRGGPPAMLGFEGGAPALRGGQAQGAGFGPRGKAFGRAEMFRERGLWPRIRARVAQHMRWRMLNRGAGDGAAMRRFGADGDRYLTAREFRAAMKKLFQRLDREGRIGPEKSGKPDRGPRDGFGKMNKKKTEEKRRPRSGAGRPMDREE